LFYVIMSKLNVTSSKTSFLSSVNPLNYYQSPSIQPTNCSLKPFSNASDGTVILNKDFSGIVVADNEISAKTDFIEFKNPEQANFRFADYFSLLEVLETKRGAVETHESKQVRPFLLSNEVSLSKPTSKMKGNKKGKGKGKGKTKGGEISKVYTFSNPPPANMNYVRANKPYNFSQQFSETTVFTSSATLATFSATSFNFNQLDNATAFQTLFDQYIIDEIEVWIEPLTTSTNGGAGGYLYSVIDYDDGNVLSNVAAAADYTNVMVSASTEGHYRRFKPHIAVAAYSGAFTSFTNEPSQWIDMSSPSVQHYGVKTACSTTTAAIIFTLRARYHFRVRNVR